VNGTLVIDTNIALDVLVFEDPATQALRQALEQRQCRWLITQSMLDEARRVLDYPLIARRMATRELRVDGVMARWHELSTLLEPAPKAPYTCKDADDQPFIDLAVMLYLLFFLLRDGGRLIRRIAERLPLQPHRRSALVTGQASSIKSGPTISQLCFYNFLDIACALGVTFPFNLLIGIPLYLKLAPYFA
jgi:putative PIN family toxin of toxin-antitoxin system